MEHKGAERQTPFTFIVQIDKMKVNGDRECQWFHGGKHPMDLEQHSLK